jgi:thiamine pyrophosphokinase
MSRAIIIANGDAPGKKLAADWLRAGDTLICADGGGRAALALGLQVVLASLLIPLVARLF